MSHSPPHSPKRRTPSLPWLPLVVRGGDDPYAAPAPPTERRADSHMRLSADAATASALAHRVPRARAALTDVLRAVDGARPRGLPRRGHQGMIAIVLPALEALADALVNFVTALDGPGAAASVRDVQSLFVFVDGLIAWSGAIAHPVHECVRGERDPARLVKALQLAAYVAPYVAHARASVREAEVDGSAVPRLFDDLCGAAEDLEAAIAVATG